MARHEIDMWVPRNGISNADVTPDYSRYLDYFTLKVYHGGCLRNNKYVGGSVNYYDYVDNDRMSLLEVDTMVVQLNPMYADQIICYFYRVAGETNE